MRSIKIIFSLLLIIAALVFAVQNVAEIDVHFLLWHFTLPTGVVLTALLGIGFFLGVLFYSLMLHRRK